MTPEDAGPTGLLVLRLWTEPRGGMRVRLTSTIELQQTQPATTYAASRAEVLLLVARWLDDLAPPESR